MVETVIALSNLNGVSGGEDDVRAYILKHAKKFADTVRVDNIGSVIAFKKGTSGEKTVMLSAHIDEAGFIISGVTDSGFLKFKTVGSIDARSIISKCVSIYGRGENGIIGMKAVHLQKKDERERAVEAKELYIDIGAKNKSDALKRVKIGDYVSFLPNAEKAGGYIRGKALGGRAGCACLMRLMEKKFENDVYFLFTAQREVGMRGAACAAHGINADRALVIDYTESADMYGVKEKDAVAHLGGGVCVDFMDKNAIPDVRMTQRFYEFLKNAGINVQKKQSASGLTDAGGIQQSGHAKTAVCLTIPVRYAHTQACMISEEDIKAAAFAAEIFTGRAGDVF